MNALASEALDTRTYRRHIDTAVETFLEDHFATLEVGAENRAGLAWDEEAYHAAFEHAISRRLLTLSSRLSYLRTAVPAPSQAYHLPHLPIGDPGPPQERSLPVHSQAPILQGISRLCDQTWVQWATRCSLAILYMLIGFDALVLQL